LSACDLCGLSGHYKLNRKKGGPSGPPVSDVYVKTELLGFRIELPQDQSTELVIQIQGLGAGGVQLVCLNTVNTRDSICNR
jgi:hypothetical protein